MGLRRVFILTITLVIVSIVAVLVFLYRSKKAKKHVHYTKSLPDTIRPVQGKPGISSSAGSKIVKIIPGNAQHIGVREEQQDAFGFSSLEDVEIVARNGVLAVVADGMGGLAMGKEASGIAVSTMLKAYTAKMPDESIPEALNRILLEANNAVLNMAKKSGLEGEVGTTLAAVVIYNNDELYWISAGDSRIYLYRGSYLTKLTKEHIYARELTNEVIKGNISREEALSHPDGNALTSYLGLPNLREVDRNIKPLALKPGDYIVLCSDGLYGALTEQEFSEAMNGNPQHIAELLVQKALSKNQNYQDNLTVAILACD